MDSSESLTGKAALVTGGSRGIGAAGTTATDRLADPTPEQRAQMGESFTLGRVGEPANTAAPVAVRASEEAGFITGQIIYNYGGQTRPIGRAA